jgi:hypothetical protein
MIDACLYFLLPKLSYNTKTPTDVSQDEFTSAT